MPPNLLCTAVFAMMKSSFILVPYLKTSYVRNAYGSKSIGTRLVKELDLTFCKACIKLL